MLTPHSRIIIMMNNFESSITFAKHYLSRFNDLKKQKATSSHHRYESAGHALQKPVKNW